MTAFLVILLASATLSAGGGDSVQAPAPPPPPAETAPTPPPNYQYMPDGRRDPFVSLVNRGTDSGRASQAPRVRPEGLRGILVDEVMVRGIVQSRGGLVAMIGSPSGRTYTIRPGDRLMDGTVRTITQQMVVLMQDVNDPLSLEKQREVRKYLRGEVK
jgi:Tfp pilus assembly protein PilP